MYALECVGLDDWFQKQLEGIHTMIDQDKLSSGEIQKLSLAKIFYNDYDVIILDEATSAIDPNSEQKIMNHVIRLAHEMNKIVVCISHKRYSLEIADEIFVMKNGNFIANGTHLELINASPEYHELLSEVN